MVLHWGRRCWFIRTELSSGLDTRYDQTLPANFLRPHFTLFFPALWGESCVRPSLRETVSLRFCPAFQRRPTRATGPEEPVRPASLCCCATLGSHGHTNSTLHTHTHTRTHGLRSTPLHPSEPLTGRTDPNCRVGSWSTNSAMAALLSCGAAVQPQLEARAVSPDTELPPHGDPLLHLEKVFTDKEPGSGLRRKRSNISACSLPNASLLLLFILFYFFLYYYV